MFNDLALVENKAIRGLGINMIFDRISRYDQHTVVTLTVVYDVNDGEDFKTEISVEHGDLLIDSLTKQKWEVIYQGNVIYHATRMIEEGENGMDILMASISGAEF